MILKKFLSFRKFLNHFDKIFKNRFNVKLHKKFLNFSEKNEIKKNFSQKNIFFKKFLTFKIKELNFNNHIEVYLNNKKINFFQIYLKELTYIFDIFIKFIIIKLKFITSKN
jgi:hypothetical protein